MTGHKPAPHTLRWLALILFALILWTATTASGRNARRTFFASLRIARPQSVAVNVAAFSGPAGSHRLQDAVATMLADSAHVIREAPDTTVHDVATAARLAGFTPAFIAARTDTPALSVLGARSITMRVNRADLVTVLAEAGRPAATVPPAVDGGTLTIDTPAGIAARYGHCPTLEGQTLTNQIAQRPPPAAESADCVIVEQRPVVSAQLPPGLDMQLLAGVAAEVAGMSPDQARDFQSAMPWAASLALVMPRFMRSYEMTTVNGAPAMLLNTAGRRGPNYELLWTAGGRAFTLTGYGNSADAARLAASIR